jgi:hypothetical protein
VKRARLVALLGVFAAPVAAAAWLGCSSSSSPGDAANDGGTDTSIADTAPAADVAPPDTAPPDNEAITCDNYCARVLANCTGDAAQYLDLPTCLAMCKALPLGDAGDTSGNTIACRMYHAGALAQRSPNFHCPHAGPYGAAVCGTRCAAFCTLAGAQCASAFSGEAGTCDASCGAAFDYTPDAAENPQGPTAGDTLNCREHELEQAFGDPAHCGNVGRTPAADAGGAFPCR